MTPRSALAFATMLTACARTVVPTFADVPDVPPLPCDASVPLGTVHWRTQLSQDIDLYGPLAADADGNIYFVHDASLLGRTDPAPYVVSLDACGGRRWQMPWTHFENRSVVLFGMVVGEQFVVANADVRSFDLASGALRWTLDVNAFAAREGLGEISGSNAIRAMAGDGAGSLYVLLQSTGTVAIVRVNPSGTPSIVTRTTGISRDSSASDLVIDSQLSFVFGVTDTNVSPGPGVVHSFTIDGTERYATHLPVLNYQDHFAVGNGEVISGDDGTVLGNDGFVIRRLDVQFAGPQAVDAASASYSFESVSSAGIVLTSFDAMGARRWRTPLNDSLAFSYGSGPLLGQRNGFIVFDRISNAPDGGVGIEQLLVSFDLANGSPRLFAFPGRGSGHAVFTARGDVVFVVEGAAVAVSAGGEVPAIDAIWPGPHGGADQRGAARGF